ncbi:MAG: hypothetical protein IPM42_04180 [Saprospiraceae bacterium]|nr:hypothetical protein [Saprospiraceae bacterium]
MILSFLSSCTNFESESDQKSEIDMITEKRVVGCDDSNVSGCEILTFSSTMMFEGCEISYTGKYQFCPAQGLYIQEPEWTIGTGTLACKELRRKIAQIYAASHGDGLTADFLNSINLAVLFDERNKLMDYYSGIPGETYFKCTGGNPSNFAFSRASKNCIRYCLNLVLDEDGQLSLGSITYVTCGVACCRKITYFCFDYSSNPPILNLGQTLNGGEDGGCFPYNNNCRGNTNTTCLPACDRL